MCFFKGVKIFYEENLGFVDFHPASHIGVVYAAEADLVSQSSIRRKLAKLRKVGVGVKQDNKQCHTKVKTNWLQGEEPSCFLQRHLSVILG